MKCYNSNSISDGNVSKLWKRDQNKSLELEDRINDLL